MIKFFVWLVIFAAIHPYLAIAHVIGEIIWILIQINKDAAGYAKPRRTI